MVPPLSPGNAKSVPPWGRSPPVGVGERAPRVLGFRAASRNLRRPGAVFRNDTKAPDRVPVADERSDPKMNRFSRLFASALIGTAGLAATALAGGPADSSANGYGHAGWHGFASRHLQKCLASAGVSTEQQAAIDQIQSDYRPAMQANFAAMKAAEDKLRNDVASNADKSTLGQDVLDKQAVMDKIK